MTLKDKQVIFIQNLCKQITWSFENGYQVTIGEAGRTTEQQLLYFEGFSIQKIGASLHFVKSVRKTKTMYSQHLKRLAIDLNYFVDGNYTTEKTALQKAGDYWKSLNPSNVWGGDWEWDTNHFEMK
jgi:hypothetical protein